MELCRLEVHRGRKPTGHSSHRDTRYVIGRLQPPLQERDRNRERARSTEMP